MDIGKAFKYMFDDEDWLKKIAIGGVLNIIPVVNFIPFGYGLRQLKNVSQGRDLPLPEWDDFGGDFMRGLIVFVGGLIYILPVILLQILAVIIGAVASGSSSEASGVGALCASALSCLMVLYGIAMMVWLPAAILKHVETGELGGFFRFSEIWDFVRTNISQYIVVVLLNIVAQLVASIVGGIACGIGVVFTTFWATLVMVHLLGQLGGATASGNYTGAMPPYGTTPPPPMGGEL